MRLTAAEYARGLVSWMPIEGVELQIGTARTADAEKTWTEHLTDSSGSLVPIDLQAVFAFKIWLKGEAQAIPAEFWVRIERVEKGVVMTRVYHGMATVQKIIRHLPDYGTYHRLVVDAAVFSWDEDVVYRELGILVRFVTGEIEGERVTNMKATITESGQAALELEQSTQKLDGRFIEVVTPGSSARQAEQHAFATLGLLAIALGRSVMGPVLFSEPWVATPVDQAGIAMATGAEFPRHAAGDELDLMNDLLFRMTVEEPMTRARVIALRWYERGLRASTPLDKVLSLFIGIETLVAAYAKVNAPLPIEQKRKNDDDAILALIKKLGNAVVSRVAGRIRGTSIREQFAFYAEKRGLGAAETSRFDKAKNIRDSAVHGDEVDVTFEVARDAEQLLRAMLKSDFDVAGTLPWEEHPVLHEVVTHFALVPADWVPPPADAPPQ